MSMEDLLDGRGSTPSIEDEVTAAVEFTIDELWFMRKFIRHDMADADAWDFPPISYTLNDQIGQALLLCHETQDKQATLLLALDDCLVLDYVIPDDYVDADGITVSKNILLKSYGARRDIELEPAPAHEHDRKFTEADKLALQEHFNKEG